MKVQDIVFITALLVVILLKGKYAYYLGLGCLALASLLFFANNLFSSQRLSWYAAAFIGLHLCKEVYTISKKRKI